LDIIIFSLLVAYGHLINYVRAQVIFLEINHGGSQDWAEARLLLAFNLGISQWYKICSLKIVQLVALAFYQVNTYQFNFLINKDIFTFIEK